MYDSKEQNSIITLSELLHGVCAEPVAAIPVKGISCHSKKVRSQDVFVAIKGIDSDGHDYIDEAINRGASAVIAQHDVPNLKSLCPLIIIPDTRKALVVIASRFFNHPSRRLRLVGITGTNGKTTTTYLLKRVLDSSKRKAGLIGSIVYEIGGRSVPSTNTTPGPLELQQYFAQMVRDGLEWSVMEVSSHALEQGRIDGLEFDVAIFSNLGVDHLDYHKSHDAYAAVKRKFFNYLKSDGTAVINVDDAFGRDLAETISHDKIMTYGIDHAADVKARDLQCSWQGTSMVIESSNAEFEIHTSLLGKHNAWNVLASTAALLALGLSPADIQKGIESIESVPGRLERVPNELGINVLIDYAHTAEALRLVLLSIRQLIRGQLIVVFGCGGDRDQSKRPIMGNMASRLADHVILTSDNPRKENPLTIIEHIKAGFSSTFKSYQVLMDREQAIHSALFLAKKGDTVLIAGKGHESYQILDNVYVPFSDRNVVCNWIEHQDHHQVAMANIA